jgi:phosphoribosylformimino-5-aminoimidazole carboxamide ribotide isomerase
MVNFSIISQIAQSAVVPVQLGGGVRDVESIRKLLNAGVDRVVLGTAAVENPELVREACRNFGESIIVSLDCRDGKMAVKGWQEATDLPTIVFARQMMELGVKRFVFTDIARDGTLTEPNFTALYELIHAIKAPVIASGGIANLSHLKILQLLGASAAILGKSIYTGAIDLREALSQ